jgi:glycosyltransferase involved in cell wall biosynthesis
MFLARQLGQGGAERQLYLLARGLRHEGVECQVLSFGETPDEFWTAILEQAGVPVDHVPGPDGWRRAARARRRLRDARPDLVHAFHFNAAAYGVLGVRPRRLPVVAGLRSLPESRFVTPTWSQRLTLRSADAVVVNSEAARRLLASRFASTPPVHVVPNAVELPAAESLMTSRERLRRELGVHGGAVVAGLVGRLEPFKRGDLFLGAIRALRDAGLDILGVVAGEGPERPWLESLRDSLNLSSVVRLVGRIDDAATLMAAFDVAVLASDTESMSNVLLEAAAAGVPVVATDVGGAAEVIGDGTTGLLVRAGDQRALENGMGRLLRDEPLRRVMGERARDAAARFNVTSMVRRYQVLYAELIERRNAS